MGLRNLNYLQHDIGDLDYFINNGKLYAIRTKPAFRYLEKIIVCFSLWFTKCFKYETIIIYMLLSNLS